MNIRDSVTELRRKLDEINPAVQIVAATKTRTIEEIRECMDTGLCVAAGENRVQELRDKYVPDFRWDFIGRLQTNKVKYVVGKAELIHSLDRLELAEVIDKEAKKHGLIQDVLVEINSGEEESKGGILLADTDAFLDKLSAFSNLKVRGLMAVAPVDFSEDMLRKTFTGVYEVFFRLKNDEFRYLSMGMSGDCFIAAECGANIVRVGRTIFGERNYT